MLNIMTSKPRVTTTSRPNPNQPSTMAAVPTPDLTLPFPRSWAIVLAATAAVCCHITDTSTKTDEMNIVASATCDTALDGKGFTSCSDPSGLVVVCHPGNVARRMKVKNARTMAMMRRYGKTIAFLNVLATHIRLSGSWSMLTRSASAVALLLHMKAPSSTCMQIPKYPTLTLRSALPTMLAIAVVTPGSTWVGLKTGGYCR